MAIEQTLSAEVEQIYKTAWETRVGRDVPDAETVGLGNKGVKLDATVLYADLADSTGLVTGFQDTFAAEVYKTYLVCACRIIKANGGVA